MSTLYSHKVGEVGTRFAVRLQAPSATGVLEDVSLDNLRRAELEFLKPYGKVVVVEARKASDSNDIEWTNRDPKFLDEVGTWRLSANAEYQDDTYIKGVRGDLFLVVQ